MKKQSQLPDHRSLRPAALYVRAGTASNGANSITAQIDRAKAFCNQQGFRLVGSYCDITDGIGTKRPGLQRALDDGANRRFEILVIENLSRLSGAGHELEEILRQLDAAAVSLLSTRDGIDLSTAYWRFLTAVHTGDIFADTAR